MDEKSTGIGVRISRRTGKKREENYKSKEKKKYVAALSHLYPSTCLTWVALPEVLKLQPA